MKKDICRIPSARSSDDFHITRLDIRGQEDQGKLHQPFSMKKEFSTKDREELLNTLKARFEKNTNRHKNLEGPKVQAKLEGKIEKLWSLNEMERTGGELDVVRHDKRQTNTFFMIVRRKALKAAEVFATTVKRWSRGKNIN
jgi:Protein of unknown function (DUF4256)